MYCLKIGGILSSTTLLWILFKLVDLSGQADDPLTPPEN